MPKRGYLFAAEVSSVEPVVAAPRAARRLAAILAADVVGYSRLMGQDEQGTLQRLKAHRKELIEPLVAEHRGRIVNLAGDSALCEFPSVVEAVACAVAIQDGMAGRELDLPAAERIRFRIGVNVGDVIVEGEEIYGDGVNVAARLEGRAEPGGVCVSGKVYDEVRGKLDLGFEDLGELALKNIAKPVRGWRVADAARRRGGWPVPVRRPGWRCRAALHPATVQPKASSSSWRASADASRRRPRWRATAQTGRRSPSPSTTCPSPT